MGIKRIGKHLLLNRWRVRRAFPRQALANIEKAIKASEATHAGQIRFVVEGALDGAPLFKDQPARARAIDVFAQLRLWDTLNNNGILIYLLLADRDVEIVADRGIDRKVGAAAWQAICAQMERAFRERRYADAVVQGVDEVSALLAQHFPHTAATRNELSDKPFVL